MTQQAANRPGSRICSSCVSTCTPWPCRGQRRLTPQPQLERKLQKALCQQCLRVKAAASGMPIGWCLPSLPRAESCRPCPQRPHELAARPCLMKTRKPMVPAFALPQARDWQLQWTAQVRRDLLHWPSVWLTRPCARLCAMAAAPLPQARGWQLCQWTDRCGMTFRTGSVWFARPHGKELQGLLVCRAR